MAALLNIEKVVLFALERPPLGEEKGGPAE
jgi:hypothetical protein